MSDNVLESYLVKLSSSVDTGSFNKFNSTLKDSAKTFGDFSLGSVANFVKLETALVGMFAAVGTGIIGLADKTAIADQQYRLFGLRMLMGTDAARSMTMALDALGVSMDQAAYDPELNRRFRELDEWGNKLGKGLGPNFEKNMIGIRDLREEYSKFGMELQMLGAGTVSKIFEDLGFGSGDALKKLQSLNNWIADRLPKWSAEIATDLTPIMRDFWSILGDVKDVGESLGLEFTNLVGIFSDDKSIEGSTFDFHKFAGAVKHVADDLAILVHWMSKAEEIAVRFMPIFGGAAAGGAIGGTVGTAWGGIAGAVAGAPLGPLGMLAGGALGAVGGGITGTGIGTVAGGITGGAVMLGEEGVRYANGDSNSGKSGSASIADQARQQAQRVSEDTGIPANLIFAQWEHETGKFKNRGATDLNNLGGMRMPGTSEYRKFGSMGEFASAYEKLLESSRYTSQGINQATNVEQFAHALKLGGYYEDSESNYSHGMRSFQQDYAGSGAPTPVSVTIGSIVVPPNTPTDEIPHHIQVAINGAIEQHAMKTTRNTMAQTAGGAYA